MLLHVSQSKFLPGMEEPGEITSQDAGHKLKREQRFCLPALQWDYKGFKKVLLLRGKVFTDRFGHNAQNCTLRRCALTEQGSDHCQTLCSFGNNVA